MLSALTNLLLKMRCKTSYWVYFSLFTIFVLYFENYHGFYKRVAIKISNVKKINLSENCEKFFKNNTGFLKMREKKEKKKLENMELIEKSNLKVSKLF